MVRTIPRKKNFKQMNLDVDLYRKLMERGKIVAFSNTSEGEKKLILESDEGQHQNTQILNSETTINLSFHLQKQQPAVNFQDAAIMSAKTSLKLLQSNGSEDETTSMPNQSSNKAPMSVQSILKNRRNMMRGGMMTGVSSNADHYLVAKSPIRLNIMETNDSAESAGLVTGNPQTSRLFKDQ